MEFNRYFTNEALFEVIHEWEQQYPELISIGTIGESYQKQPIWLLTVTNKKTGSDLIKPAVWLDANIHATEITGTTSTLLIAYKLLSGWGKEAEITRTLDNGVFYIVPRLNPDGAALAMSTSPRYIRSGVRYYPWEEKDEGLHSQDIDGDGRILQMRITDPNGEWKTSSLDPRLLEKRQPHEHGGTYYRLLPEGLIEDYDGDLVRVAKPQEGLDFNRNFPFEWRPEGDQRGAGPFPTSEPEVRALVDFVSKHPNINFALSYHTFSRVLLRPFGTRSDDEMETQDLWVFKKLGKIGTELTGYRCVSTFHDFKYHPKEIITGVFDDWIYDHLGVFSFTVEQWDLPTEAGIKERKFIEWFQEHPHEEDLQILKWVDEKTSDEGFVQWYSYEHPQLGSVEIGGWDSMYTWRNPPLEFIGAEAERNSQFAISLGSMLPKLEIVKIESTPLGNGDYAVTLVVENAGFLPTYTSEQARKKKAVRPVRAELILPVDGKLIKGKRKVELGHLGGRSNRLGVTMIWDSSPTDNRAKTDWVVNVEPGSKLTIKILSERAGSNQFEITLGE